MTSPLSPSTSAGESGRSLPAARTNSGTDRSGISTSGYGLARATDVLLGAGVAPVSHPGNALRPAGALSVQRGQSTDWVQRNSAIRLPDPASVTRASQTCVVRPAWTL